MQSCHVQLAFTVWWRNGRAVKSLKKQRQKSVFSNKKAKQICIERSGVRQQTDVGVCDAEEAENTLKCKGTCEGPKWLRGDSPNTSWEDGANHVWEDKR